MANHNFLTSALWVNMQNRIAGYFYDLANSSGRFLENGAAWLIKRWLPRFLLAAITKPPKIALIPIDLNLSDSALAYEFYHGRFALAGRIVRAGAVSPWLIEPPSTAWEEALHDFGWLRHMNIAKTALAVAHARTLVDEWITLSDKYISRTAWKHHITARRIISWLSHADMLLADGSPTFQNKFLKSLNLNIRYLRILQIFAGKSQRLEICLALCFVALACAQSPAQLHRAEQRLERALATNILPDGGHVSRNPAALVPILADLLALYHLYQQDKKSVPKSFITTLKNIHEALRFFQHRDQSLADFNGVVPLLPERLNGLLNIHPATLPPPENLPDSGYQRLCHGATTVIVDTGCPPQGHKKIWSSSSHAGCLSFEMSSGAHRFIINCGIDPYGNDEFHFLGRLTAAHSTATLNDTSSCQFLHSGLASSLISTGPDKIKIKHVKGQDCNGFVANHNGYARHFNLLHQRSMALSTDGNLLQGADRFVKVKQEREIDQITATVRFHLHPDVEVSQLDNKSLRLEVMRADVWILTCQAEMHLEDSIYFCGLQGPLKTRQIVFSFNPKNEQEIYWAFQRQVHNNAQLPHFQRKQKARAVD